MMYFVILLFLYLFFSVSSAALDTCFYQKENLNLNFSRYSDDYAISTGGGYSYNVKFCGTVTCGGFLDQQVCQIIQDTPPVYMPIGETSQSNWKYGPTDNALYLLTNASSSGSTCVATGRRGYIRIKMECRWNVSVIENTEGFDGTFPSGECNYHFLAKYPCYDQGKLAVSVFYMTDAVVQVTYNWTFPNDCQTCYGNVRLEYGRKECLTLNKFRSIFVGQGTESAPLTSDVTIGCSQNSDCNSGTCVSSVCVCSVRYNGSSCGICAPDYFNFPTCFYMPPPSKSSYSFNTIVIAASSSAALLEVTRPDNTTYVSTVITGNQVIVTNLLPLTFYRFRFMSNGFYSGYSVFSTAGEVISFVSSGLNNPHGMAFDPKTSKLYVADTDNNRIVSISPNGNMETVYTASNGRPFGLAIDAEKQLLFCSTQSGIFTMNLTIVPSTQTFLNLESSVYPTIVKYGNNTLYFTETVWAISKWEFPLTTAYNRARNQLFSMTSIRTIAGFDRDIKGDLYVGINHNFGRVKANGIFEVFSNISGYVDSKQGAFLNISDISYQNETNSLFVVDRGNKRIRLATMDGYYTTIAGSDGSGGFLGGSGDSVHFDDLNQIIPIPGAFNHFFISTLNGIRYMYGNVPPKVNLKVSVDSGYLMVEAQTIVPKNSILNCNVTVVSSTGVLLGSQNVTSCSFSFGPLSVNNVTYIIRAFSTNKFGVSETSVTTYTAIICTNPCNGRGACGLSNNCTCFSNYDGDSCERCKEFYYPVQTCNKYCNPQTTCQGKGTCTATGECLCFTGFNGSDCSACANNYYGSSCQFCTRELNCSGNGLCGVNGCDCDPHFYGSHCSNCVANYYGPTCSVLCDAKVTCKGAGVCNNTGDCVCNDRFTSLDCGSCISDHYGPSCDKFCTSATNCSNHGSCNNNGVCECNAGFTGLDCSSCVSDRYGPACDKFCNRATSCSAHGSCNSTGDCECFERFTGLDCGSCISDHYGPLCDKFCIGAVNCSGHGSCKNTGECECNAGFSGLDCSSCIADHYGPTCAKFCNRAINCSDHGSCKSTGECECSEGFTGLDCASCVSDHYGPSCDKFCNRATNCSGHGSCNNIGECSCDVGYAAPDCFSCLPTFTGTDCSPTVCSCINGQCNATNYCVCSAGYHGTGISCTDINECDNGLHNCSLQATCSNTIGSYDCFCNDGYQGNGFECNDKNECNLMTFTCPAHSFCVNTVGNYSCECDSGFTKNGNLCVDVNECFIGTAVCPERSNCSNTFGGYDCLCFPGFKKSNTNNCIDINECLTNNGGCDYRSTCINTIGNRTCSGCPVGFYGSGYTTCTSLCGDTICNSTIGEDCVTCFQDCNTRTCNRCGDGQCDTAINETCTTCSDDCGVCVQLTCPGTPSCSGNGACIQGTCYCNSTYTGPSCSNPLKIITVAPNTTTPATTILSVATSNETETQQVSFQVAVQQMEELDANGRMVAITDMSSVDFNFSSSETSNMIEWVYDTILENGANVSIIQFKETTSYSFANTNTVYAPNMLKFNVLIANWPFKNLLNSLSVKMALGSNLGTGKIEATTDENSNLKYLIMNYVKFLDVSILDGRYRTVSYKLGDDNSSVSVIAPHFSSIEIDPDFSILVKPQEEEEEASSVEESSGEGDSKKRERKGVATGIIVAVAVVGGLAVSTVVFIVFVLPRFRLYFAVRREKKSLKDLDLVELEM